MKIADTETLRFENEIAKLQRSVHELTLLNQLCQEIASTHDSVEIMKNIVRRALTAVNAELGSITLAQDSKDDSRTITTWVDSGSSVGDDRPLIHVTDGLFAWMRENKTALNVPQAANFSDFSDPDLLESFKSVLCVPMMIKSRLIGALAVYNVAEDSEFDSDSVRLLSIIASLSVQVIEHAQNYEKEKTMLVMKDELDMAATIQRQLQPTEQPDIEGFEIAGRNIPAREVGGDYFDYIHSVDNEVFLCVGDVSGKGLPASLLMANLQATIRALTTVNQSCRRVLQKANGLLHESTAQEKYATFFLCKLNSLKGSFCYSNAGHNPPLLFKADSADPQLLTAESEPLGALDDSRICESRVNFTSGDLLVIYTDGITEARNAAEEEFGEQRLIKTIINNREKSPEEILEVIFEAVENYTYGEPRHDDMTVVIVKRN